MTSRSPIYATPKGKTYHSDAMCIGLNSWYTANGSARLVPEVSRPTAISRNLRPCNLCARRIPDLRVVR